MFIFSYFATVAKYQKGMSLHMKFQFGVYNKQSLHQDRKELQDWIRYHRTGDLCSDAQYVKGRIGKILPRIKPIGNYFSMLVATEAYVAYNQGDIVQFWLEVDKMLQYTSLRDTLNLVHINYLLEHVLKEEGADNV